LTPLVQTTAVLLPLVVPLVPALEPLAVPVVEPLKVPLVLPVVEPLVLPVVEPLKVPLVLPVVEPLVPQDAAGAPMFTQAWNAAIADAAGAGLPGGGIGVIVFCIRARLRWATVWLGVDRLGATKSA
jgi:hypothetical protein